MKLMMRIVATLAFLVFTSSCASKKTTTEAPAEKTAATTPAAPETKKTETEKKASHKKHKAEAKAATTTESTSSSETTCKSGSDERKLAIVAKGSGCELQYTKMGETKSIASQIVGNQKCEEVMTRIKEKLVAAQFNCQ